MRTQTIAVGHSVAECAQRSAWQRDVIPIHTRLSTSFFLSPSTPSTLCNLFLPHTVELYRQRVLPLTSVVISSFLATRPKYSSTLSAINYHIWQSQKDILPDNLWAILTPCIGIFIVSKIANVSRRVPE